MYVDVDAHVSPRTTRSSLRNNSPRPMSSCTQRCHLSLRAIHSTWCAEVELDTAMRRGADCIADGTHTGWDVREDA